MLLMERRWWTLLAVCVATFMLLVDITIVNVALPSIQQDLDASLTNLQWVVDAYALMLSALMLTVGSLADRVGRRRSVARLVRHPPGTIRPRRSRIRRPVMAAVERIRDRLVVSARDRTGHCPATVQ